MRLNMAPPRRAARLALRRSRFTILACAPAGSPPQIEAWRGPCSMRHKRKAAGCGAGEDKGRKDSMRALIARGCSAAIIAMALCAAPRPAAAADKLIVGKAFPTSFAFVPINVGVETGIMKKHGLDVTIEGFQGAAKLQQGITAGDVD